MLQPQSIHFKNEEWYTLCFSPRNLNFVPNILLLHFWKIQIFPPSEAGRLHKIEIYHSDSMIMYLKEPSLKTPHLELPYHPILTAPWTWEVREMRWSRIHFTNKTVPDLCEFRIALAFPSNLMGFFKPKRILNALQWSVVNVMIINSYFKV